MAQSPQPVLQRGYDANVSGANLSETTLNTSNVNKNSFGAIFTLNVDDNILAQPLYVPNVTVPNHGTHNVVYVATMNDTIYAFDADVGGAALWSVNLAPFDATAVDIANFTFDGNVNIIGHLGILSTPVIDPSTNIMYVVEASTTDNVTIEYRLHAIDITTGNEVYGPVTIAGSYHGVTFDPSVQLQRVSLVLSGNQVVLGFGPIEEEDDNYSYTGWVIAYDKTSLQQTGIFATDTTGQHGVGVWQSGRPPVVDSSGYIYVFTGNGYGAGTHDGNNFSESALKFNPSNLNLVSYFTPPDWSTLDEYDLDLSCSGPLMIPGTSLLAGGGKDGVLYVLESTDLGNDSQYVQRIDNITNGGEMRGGPVYWQSNGGSLLYDWGSWDSLKAFAFNGETFATSPSSESSNSANWPGGILTLSANGQQSGTGVLWATVVTGDGDDENNPPQPGELLAFNGGNVSQELWDTTMNASSDQVGNFAKFVPPLVANGKVYVATWSNQVVVYGLKLTLSPAAAAFGSQTVNVASAPVSVTVADIGKQAVSLSSITLSGTNASQYSQTNTCGGSVAAGGSCTINVVFKPTAAGAASATLNVNLAGGSVQSVSLTGTGIVPTYTVSPSSLAFGSQAKGVASASMPITVSNTGAVALPITSIALAGANPAQFSQSNSCGSSIAIGGSCTINAVFKPTTTGSKSATVSVNTGEGAGTQSVTLTGTGVVPAYTVSPSSLAFGDEVKGVASASMPITVSNTGAVALPITSIALVGANPGQFSQSNNCGSSIAIGGSCTINAIFSPSATGSLSATVNVNAGEGAGTQSVALTGTGVSPSYTYTVSPTSLAFGSEALNVASAAMTATVTNTGNAVLPITSLTLTGTNAAQFQQSNTCGSSVAIGGNCTISAVFKPTRKGSMSATVSIKAGDGAGTQTVALTGTGD
jgi:hypothetical protein